MTIENVRKLALSFEAAEEKPHFDNPSFRVKNKIFATIDLKNQRACLMLSPEDQSVFSVYNKNIIYPVPNAWGKKGATYVDIKKVPAGLFKDALTCAYCSKAPEVLSKKYRKE